MNTTMYPDQTFLRVPNGLNEVVSTFGNIAAYVKSDGTIDPRWERDNMIAIPIPFAIPLSWDKTKSVTTFRMHKLLKPVLQATFAEIVLRGLSREVKTYGGAYTFRAKRGVQKYSAHAWGIAFDLNTATNGMGGRGDMSIQLVNLLREFGWKWGGDWRGRGQDPMHFQYCTGY